MSREWVIVETRMATAGDFARAPWRFEAHDFQRRKRLPYLVCSGCGLVLLRNPLTAWCVRHGCLHDSHPGYPSAVRELSAREAA